MSSENANWRQSTKKYKGRVVLRGDIVKDDSGSYAVFTEQGSSASQMTAAKIMDIISRLPGCDGQAADAVSAYTQVKMEGLGLPYWTMILAICVVVDESKCLDTPIWEFSRICENLPLERNLYGHPLAGLMVKAI